MHNDMRLTSSLRGQGQYHLYWTLHDVTAVYSRQLSHGYNGTGPTAHDTWLSPRLKPVTVECFHLQY